MTNLSSETDNIGGVPTVKFGEVLDVEPKEPTSNVSGSSIRPRLELASDSGIGVPTTSSTSAHSRLNAIYKDIKNCQSEENFGWDMNIYRSRSKFFFWNAKKITLDLLSTYSLKTLCHLLAVFGNSEVSYFSVHHFTWSIKILLVARLCGPDSFTLSLLCQLTTPETALGSKINKLQQFFYTLSVSQDFSLFLALTYSSNIISITCILCKTVSSASRTLVIT